jgi:uncharacterized membrane protein
MTDIIHKISVHINKKCFTVYKIYELALIKFLLMVHSNCVCFVIHVNTYCPNLKFIKDITFNRGHTVYLIRTINLIILKCLVNINLQLINNKK